MEDLKQQYLDELKRLSNLEYRDEIKIAELTKNFNGMSIEIRKKEKLLQQEQWAYFSTHPSKRLTSFCYDDDEEEDYTSAITPNVPVLSTEEPDNSLSMGDEHLDTIPATKSDEVIKSSVKDLIPIPSESEGLPDHRCDVPSQYNSPPLDVPSKIDSLLYEFADELTLLKSIPPGIDEADCDFEEDIRLIEKLLYDNSSPRPLKEFVSANSDAESESFSPSPILVKDSDSLMEEIDLLYTPDYPMPSGIVGKDYDSKMDILIRKDLLSNNTLSFDEKESFHFDIPLFSRPPAKPSDGDTGILNIKMMGDIYDQKAFMHELMITLASHQKKSLDLLSHRGLKAFHSFATCPMMIHGQNNPILDVLLFHFYPP
nr:hypothetical protein [Tanacetum cinerariifolium]